MSRAYMNVIYQEISQLTISQSKLYIIIKQTVCVGLQIPLQFKYILKVLQRKKKCFFNQNECFALAFEFTFQLRLILFFYPVIQTTFQNSINFQHVPPNMFLLNIHFY